MPIPTVESTYAPLPFLVEHGAWIWKALIGLTAVAAPGVARLRRRRRAAVRVARVVRVATNELRAGPVALRGRLRGADVRSSRQQVWGYPAPDVAATRAEDALVTVGDVQVRFDGDVEVVAGSRATLDRRAGRTRDGALIAWRQELTVDVGAEVVCVGRLAQGDDGAWTLCAAAEQPLELYALAHRGAAEPIARMRIAVQAVLAGIGMTLFLCLLGFAMDARIREAARGERTSIAAIPARVQVAAMTPTGRSAAMAWLDGAAEDVVGREQIGRALAVARLRGTDLLVQQLRDLDRHDELLALARRRGDDALTFEALTRLARFDEAAEVMPRVPEVGRGVAVEVAIAAGRWTEAASLVKASAEARAAGPGREALTCLAAWLGMKGGDVEAGEALERAARSDQTCKMMVDAAADAQSPPQQPWPFANFALNGRWRDVDLALRGLWVSCSIGSNDVWMLPYVALHLGAVVDSDAMNDAFVDEYGIGSAARLRYRCRAAWALVADQPGASPERLETDAVYTAAPVLDVETTDIMAPAAALRRRVLDDYGLMLTDARERALVLDAFDGDARPLARYLKDHPLIQRLPIAIGLAPRLVAGQVELVEALLWSPRLTEAWLGDESLIGDTLQRAFLRRQVLRLLGRDDLAASDAAIVARVVEVFADRDKVLALAFWSAR